MSIYNMQVFKREVRHRRLKRALAWIGVVVAGSLIVFSIGVTVTTWNFGTMLVSLVISALLGWGLWGFIHLKTRH